MINQREISKWQFIFQFWKKALIVLFIASIVWGIIRALLLYTGRFPSFDAKFVVALIGALIGIILDNDTDPYYQSTPWFRTSLIGLLNGLISIMVLFYANTLVEYTMRDYASVPNKVQVNATNSGKIIHVDQLAVDKQDLKSVTFPFFVDNEKVNLIYEVVPTKDHPNVYVCKCRENEKLISLKNVNFTDLCLREVTSEEDLKQYRAAASLCNTPLPEGTQVKDITFMEIVPKGYDAEESNNSNISKYYNNKKEAKRNSILHAFILMALGGAFIWTLLFYFFSEGPYYPIEYNHTLKKYKRIFNSIKLSNVAHNTWLTIRWICQSPLLFIFYIPVICFLLTVFGKPAEFHDEAQMLSNIGEASPSSIFDMHQYWKLLTCVFVHENFHNFWDIICYLILAVICFMYTDWVNEKRRVLFLFLFYWTGTVIANYLSVLHGMSVTGAMNGNLVLAGMGLVVCLFARKRGFFINTRYFWIAIIIDCFCIILAFVLHPNPIGYVSGLVCGIILQLLLELHYLNERKNEDNLETQHYQKEY